MATKVSATYSKTQNVSITQRDGVISLVSIWTTGGTAAETQRVGYTSKELHNFPRKG